MQQLETSKQIVEAATTTVGDDNSQSLIITNFLIYILFQFNSIFFFLLLFSVQSLYSIL